MPNPLPIYVLLYINMDISDQAQPRRSKKQAECPGHHRIRNVLGSKTFVLNEIRLRQNSPGQGHALAPIAGT
jgi:hypothetical protein